ncbi:metallophosphoesterase [Chlorobaculum sp. 24CR]|uniref:metallophosphoesterase family protein n=1 Tax=Chlorobaculum sp. 24CR TaxID=2508878 RepID=UPI00100C0261|nr:metallophosphoesterase [Chlorobaculum sp. 24CR]RXK88917.1 metallophosphoesterase [Chlorobaculum sp. 24CR]
MSVRRLFGKTGALFALFVLLHAPAAAWAEPWKFGVMGDTQWTCADPSGRNPNTVPVSIIEQVNRQFIDAGVKFVIQVGDLSDDGKEVSEEERAAAARPLLDAGIGFFAFRGNHEAQKKNENGYGAPGFRQRYRQTRDGGFTKSDGGSFTVGSNFSSPVKVSRDLDGLSYSFDCGEGEERARFVIIDNWPLPGRVFANSTHYPSGYTIADQQPWIGERLDRRKRAAPHAFVLSHQPLIAEGHQDTLFSGFANEHPDWQNAFFASLQQNGVQLFICGHDHIHQRSIISSPDGKSKVEQLIAQSCSSKFYTPKSLDDSRWFGQKSREISVSQEHEAVGYYIFTIDGPTVTVDYWADDHGHWQSDASYPQGAGRSDTGVTPQFHFAKKERWSYSLNGKQFLVPQGASYAVVRDRFNGAEARILDGLNASESRDASPATGGGRGRVLTKVVGTGWIAAKPSKHRGNNLASAVLLLGGLGELGGQHTDTYVLSMSYDTAKVRPKMISSDGFGLVTKDAAGRWINAVEANSGGAATFIDGPWKRGYALGSYGIDRKHHRAWAVMNHEGAFAVANFSAH